jgi:hypothetical protein
MRSFVIEDEPYSSVQAAWGELQFIRWDIDFVASFANQALRAELPRTSRRHETHYLVRKDEAVLVLMRCE